MGSRELKIDFPVVWGLGAVVEYQSFLITLSVSMEVGAATNHRAASISRVITHRVDTVKM